MARPKKPTYEWIESRKEFRKRIKGPGGKYIALYAQTAEELTEKEREQLREEQEAFANLMNYNVDVAYGLHEGVTADDIR